MSRLKLISPAGIETGTAVLNGGRSNWDTLRAREGEQLPLVQLESVASAWQSWLTTLPLASVLEKA